MVNVAECRRCVVCFMQGRVGLQLRASVPTIKDAGRGTATAVISQAPGKTVEFQQTKRSFGGGQSRIPGIVAAKLG